MQSQPSTLHENKSFIFVKIPKTNKCGHTFDGLWAGFWARLPGFNINGVNFWKFNHHEGFIAARGHHLDIGKINSTISEILTGEKITVHMFDSSSSPIRLVGYNCTTRCVCRTLREQGEPFWTARPMDPQYHEFLHPSERTKSTVAFPLINQIQNVNTQDGASTIETRSVHVRNLTYKLKAGNRKSEREIMDKFTEAGTVTDVRIRNREKKTSAVVSFVSASEAKKAIELFHGKKWYDREMEVRPDRDEGDRGRLNAGASSSSQPAVVHGSYHSEPVYAHGQYYAQQAVSQGPYETTPVVAHGSYLSEPVVAHRQYHAQPTPATAQMPREPTPVVAVGSHYSKTTALGRGRVG